MEQPQLDSASARVNQYEKYIQNITKYKGLYNRMCAKIGDVPEKTIALLSDSNHRQFLFKLVNTEGKLFVDIESVIHTVNNYDIILNLIEYNLYAAFTNKDYFSLMNRIANHNDDYQDDPSNIIKFNMRQIIVKGWPQKLIILCNNNSTTVDKIAQYAKDHFKCNVSTSKDNEDIVSIVINDEKFNDEAELETKFSTFTSYVKSINKDLLSRTLLKRPEYDTTYRELEYFESGLDTNMIIDDISKLDSQLLSIRIIVNNTTNHYHIYGNNNNINNIVIMKEDKEKLAEMWINNNPPNAKETKGEYHNRYIASNKDGINKIIFGKLMKSMGFTHRSIKGVHYWNAK